MLNNVLPRIGGDDRAGNKPFTPATAADFGPVIFRGDRSPDDAAALLPDAAATKLIAIEQIVSDLHSSIPTHEEMQEVRLEVTRLKNRLADLKRPLNEGGSAVPATAWQIVDIERKLERAEKELARRTELKEIRTVRWNAAGQLRQSVSDWILRGIPGGCTLEAVEDAPVAELLMKVTAVALKRRSSATIAAERTCRRRSPSAQRTIGRVIGGEGRSEGTDRPACGCKERPISTVPSNMGWTSASRRSG